MDNVINWVKENWTTISTCINLLVLLATTIVGATKTDKDDKVLNFIVKILDNFSVLNPRGTETKRIDDKTNNDGK